MAADSNLTWVGEYLCSTYCWCVSGKVQKTERKGLALSSMCQISQNEDHMNTRQPWTPYLWGKHKGGRMGGWADEKDWVRPPQDHWYMTKTLAVVQFFSLIFAFSYQNLRQRLVYTSTWVWTFYRSQISTHPTLCRVVPAWTLSSRKQKFNYF